MSEFNIERFIEAQNGAISGYAHAMGEIKNGRKTGHWIWYVFPQMMGLGISSNSVFYGISCREEAEEYLSDATLSSRPREIATALLTHADKRAIDVLGHVDAMKVRSSMTLFDAICPGDVFGLVLERFFTGRRCGKTLSLLAQNKG